MFGIQYVRYAVACTGLLVCLSGEAAAYTVLEPDVSNSRTLREIDSSRIEVSPRSLQTTQVFWNYEAYRRQRLDEIERMRREREAQRQAERERWREQRSKARLDVLEREQRYREESRKRHPELGKHRSRYAQELRQRRKAEHDRRLERWQSDDFHQE